MNSEANLIHKDLNRAQLLDQSIARHEGVLSAKGVLTVETGKRTGRSPKDRFIVKDTLTQDAVDWGVVNQPMLPDVFEVLWQRAAEYLKTREYFQHHLRVGAHESHYFPVQVSAEYAWHAAFALNMFIEKAWSEADAQHAWQLVNVPGLTLNGSSDGVNSDGAVMIDMQNKRVLLCGMRYAGEMKKAMFTALNFHLPSVDVLPMHCAANVGHDGNSALFFGLSGTGKTTLSADPERKLIGDDEHGWGTRSVFNFEGGCYAKCIALSEENEPVIWQAIKPGAIMENVTLDSVGEPDFNNTSKTENTRVSYPLAHIAYRQESNQAGSPKAVVFLACDLYGVLPAISMLNIEQAAYYFLSGYTALVGSTEMGAEAGVKSTFSTCFGAPFFPRPPKVYAALLKKRLLETNAQVYLVNAGWHGGRYGQGGKRYSIATTRAVVRAATTSAFDQQHTQVLPGFNLTIPTQLPGVDATLLDPRKSWQSQKDYDASAATLIEQFQTNFKRFDVEVSVVNAGPEMISVA